VLVRQLRVAEAVTIKRCYFVHNGLCVSLDVVYLAATICDVNCRIYIYGKQYKCRQVLQIIYILINLVNAWAQDVGLPV
jgi:hypothetical protein